jgi:hypothetical protein
MGSGRRESQFEDRFGLGGPVDSFNTPCSEAEKPDQLQIGDYRIERVEDGFALRKGDETLGTYGEAALLSPDRALLKLDKGMLLEVTPEGTRDVLSPPKGGIIGFISSDGSITFSREKPAYQVRFGSKSDELLDKFEEFMKDVYDVEPKRYQHKDREHFFESIKGSKEVVEDLNKYTPKATGDWNVPFDYLDRESARMFLKCFMSGDGNIGFYPRSDHPGHRLEVRFSSKNRAGLEEMAELLDREFDMRTRIYEDDQGMCTLEVATRKDRIRYIREIGSFKKNHQDAIERALRWVG